MALPQTATRNDLTRVRAAYAFADEDEVMAFLDEHPFLVPILEAAREPLSAHFGADTPIRLEVWLDPENEVDRTLIARAETGGLPPDEAVTRLGAFWDQWEPDDAPREWWLSLRFDIA